jgi:predicted metal-binding protein
MPFSVESLMVEIKDFGIKNILVVDVSDISFSEEVRKYCEMNSCGKYDKNWTCPPGVGTAGDLSKKARRYQKGFIIQTVHPLKSSFDLKGMLTAKNNHDTVLRRVHQLAKNLDLQESLLLGAGFCDLCDPCAYIEDEPCHFPEEALVSMEACGIDVVKLAKDSGFPYHHGKGTVSYVGMILYS